MISLSYAAGFFDAEGCIVIDKQTINERPRYNLRVSVTNTFKPILQQYQERWGGTIHPHDKGTNKPVYSWQLTNRRAVEFLTDIFAELIEKQPQAHLAFDFSDNLRGPLHNRRALGPEEIAVREGYYLALQQAKKEITWHAE